jgi:ParB family chromosome partitioning protein
MLEEKMNLGAYEGEQVLEMDIDRLRDFRNHPFKITADMSMVELKESIEKFGILNPLIIRPVLDGCYEIISGHRRRYAAKQLGYRKVPVVIRVMKDEMIDILKAWMEQYWDL